MSLVQHINSEWLQTHHKDNHDKETYPHYNGKWKQKMCVDVKRQLIINWDKKVTVILVAFFQNQASLFAHKHRWDDNSWWILGRHRFCIHKEKTKFKTGYANVYSRFCSENSHPSIFADLMCKILFIHGQDPNNTLSWDFFVKLSMAHLC